MQEELNSRTMTLIIETGKLTTNVLQKAIRESLNLINEAKHHIPKGKQSLARLKSQGVSLSNVEITKDNIKSFDSVARKYHIDYALMRQIGREPPRYYVFFKGADAEILDAALREYARKEFSLEEKGTIKEVLETMEQERTARTAADIKSRPKRSVRKKTQTKVPELKR